MSVELHLGDCLEVMKSMPDKSVDAVITDPPYNISHKGKIFRDYRSGKNVGGFALIADDISRRYNINLCTGKPLPRRMV